MERSERTVVARGLGLEEKLVEREEAVVVEDRALFLQSLR